MVKMPVCVLLSVAAITSCKSRYGFTDVNAEGAVIKSDNATSTPSVPGQASIPNHGGQSTTEPTASTPGTSGTTPSNTGGQPANQTTQTPADGVPTSPGGPVVGIEDMGRWKSGDNRYNRKADPI
jgi:hypothetical protein